MAEISLTIYDTGYCVHPWRIVAGQGSWRPAKFAARVVKICHPTMGEWLFDTGYAPRFVDETQSWPERIYALTTPVTLGVPVVERLDGVRVQGVIISHYHADHVAGLKDFGDVPVLASRVGYEKILARGRFANLKKGVLPRLLPDDFAARLQPVEELPLVDLPDVWRPFNMGRDVFGDGSVYAVMLPGHAEEQFGLACETAEGPVFLIADACWLSLAYRENVLPNPIARLLVDDWKAYGEVIGKLHTLYNAQPKVRILACHCPEAGHV